ncbi:MAG: hypothetical protein E6370_17265 [Clostridiales bacterium]|nr:hypothetical protein [Clostridiales bacterium]MDU6976018.1 hypothetical protein [Clostridiales bacterium]
MKNTTNYGLKKPDGTDAVDIAIINQNMDTIDTTMKSNAAQINDLKNNKANTSHGNHVPATQSANNKKFLRCDNTWQDVTPGNIGAAAASHTHDDRYYTETEINTKLNAKANTSHTHTKSQITDFPTSLPANGGNADTVDGLHAYEIGTLDSGGNPHGTGFKATIHYNKKSDGRFYLGIPDTSHQTSVDYAHDAGRLGGREFLWHGQGGQPTWVWGANEPGNQCYVWNPATFSVRNADYVQGRNLAAEFDSLKSAVSNPKVVKGVQRGYISRDGCDYTENMYSKDYTISPVDPSKTMINLYSQERYCPVSGRLMNSNILRIYSNTSGNEIYKVSWEVIEFY